jgi:hypothetical protein
MVEVRDMVNIQLHKTKFMNCNPLLTNVVIGLFSMETMKKLPLNLKPGRKCMQAER